MSHFDAQVKKCPCHLPHCAAHLCLYYIHIYKCLIVWSAACRLLLPALVHYKTQVIITVVLRVRQWKQNIDISGEHAKRLRRRLRRTVRTERTAWKVTVSPAMVVEETPTIQIPYGNGHVHVQLFGQCAYACMCMWLEVVNITLVVVGGITWSGWSGR